MFNFFDKHMCAVYVVPKALWVFENVLPGTDCMDQTIKPRGVVILFLESWIDLI